MVGQQGWLGETSGLSTGQIAWDPTGGWAGSGCDAAPGSRADYWSIDDARVAGVAVATVHASDIAPDDADDPAPRVRAAYEPGVEARSAWGTVAAGSRGLRHAAAGLRQVSAVDGDRIAVFGHSRRDKAALWAAAQDASLVAAFPHQSGIAGAEDRRPLHQHAQLALVAPRPLRVTDGEADTWAVPEGAAEAVALASPVWGMLDGPAPDQVMRPGGHEVRPED